ncbi:cellulose-binding protein [Nonomuraea phyllanthi]|uniref:Cellulose-binding protein n=1 Tax=Nonomuraea phyllanthi TaxID=2219224 RepID=A0A5C4WIM7_9ACTN|nr:cellulose binding domain-containing protein [Nonomuraea phyllanthi]KAB8194160.1 cellulose-binding protein [Nonomuraea phyllanthi]
MSKQSRLIGAVAAAVILVLAMGRAALSSDAGGAATSAGALAATAGCGKTPTLRSGTQSIQTSGKNRSYILRLPDGYRNDTPYRLIFGFHWLGGTAAEVDSGGTSGYPWSFYGLRQMSNNGAIFVAPQGFNNGWANNNGEDITFVDDLIRLIEADLCVDTSQLFATGFSYGGAMSFSLACSRATVFRAVAVFSGAQLSGCSGGTQPIAYMGLHGIGDTVLNIAQGRALRDRFVRNNGCTAQNPPEPSSGSRSHIVTAYSGCRAGYPVVWAAFDNGHTPGPVDGTYADNGATTWTKTEVWAFFSQFGSSPSTSPTPSPTPTPTPGTGACTATMQTVNSWPGGFQSAVTVRAGDSAVGGWTVGWTWPDGQAISSLWNGVRSGSGAEVSVRNESYNGSIAAGGTTTFGFTANGAAATPTLSCEAS